MSKKYFAKYLPVEGEIKEHSVLHFKDPNPDVEGFKDWSGHCTVVHIYNEDNFVIEVAGTTTGVSRKDLFKLFLCTLDIQVGDDIKRDYSYTIRDSKVLKQRADGLVKLDGYYEWHELEKLGEAGFFKVIGEISPDATWVKEGDEFDEEDLKLVYGGETFVKFHVPKGGLGMWNVAIKGPCGHFH